MDKNQESVKVPFITDKVSSGTFPFRWLFKRLNLMIGLNLSLSFMEKITLEDQL